MKRIITHSGKFHADDVFAVATIMLAHPEEEFDVVRTRDKDIIASGDFVVDVGGEYDGKKFFDHHQVGGAGVRQNQIPYASFGLVWKEFGAVVCGGDFYIANQIDLGLVCSLDAHDNGVKVYENLFPVSPYEISEYVGAFNPTWIEEEEYGTENDAKRHDIFMSLVLWAKGLIGREIKRHKDKNIAYTKIKEIYEKTEDKRIIVLEKYMPQDGILSFPEPLFVIYPQGEGWAAKTVPKENHSFESRKDFPESWAGLTDGALAKESGVEDAVFCHNKLFLAVAKTKEGAIKLAELAL